ncbi:MAG: hypothetical protein NT133_15240 [Alphaproteobacteria bacterium]|nr:hypothetical protein [Alphaproteobacteria bacterium]
MADHVGTLEGSKPAHRALADDLRRDSRVSPERALLAANWPWPRQGAAADRIVAALDRRTRDLVRGAPTPEFDHWSNRRNWIITKSNPLRLTRVRASLSVKYRQFVNITMIASLRISVTLRDQWRRRFGGRFPRGEWIGTTPLAGIYAFLTDTKWDAAWREDRIAEVLGAAKPPYHPAWVRPPTGNPSVADIEAELARTGILADDAVWAELWYQADWYRFKRTVIPTTLDGGTIGVFHHAPAALRSRPADSGFAVDLRADDGHHPNPLPERIVADDAAFWLSRWHDARRRTYVTSRCRAEAMCGVVGGDFPLLDRRDRHRAKLVAMGYGF